MSKLATLPLRWMNDDGSPGKLLGYVVLDEEALLQIEPITQKLGVSMQSVIATGEIAGFDIFRHQPEAGEGG